MKNSHTAVSEYDIEGSSLKLKYVHQGRNET